MLDRLTDWWNKIRQTEPPLRAPERSKEAGVVAHVPRPYSSDQPITSRDQDRFNRWPFAKRIADTIANGKDPASLVIGVYGPWGDGKTSTLGLMQEALTEHPDVVLLRFNPWQFGNENQLLRAFFDSLADALGRSLSTHKEDIGEILKKYGAILSVASVDVVHTVKVDPGKGVVALGQALSSVELHQLRTRLEGFLRESGKRAVILVDDIDRLDRAEIHALFKLIKLSASFEHTSYVLAFDDEMVAAALGEKYGGGGVSAGRSFLEKIIHVPLHLPPAETIELRKMALEGIDEALKQSKINLTREQIERFTRSFVDTFEPELLHTPRQAKRLTNSVSFALPLLEGEAEPVDVMLIEAIRVFLPRLHATIRDNPDLFIGSAREYGGNADVEKKRLRDLLSSALSDSGIYDKELIRKRLIAVLFPRAGDMGYGSEWNLTWAREQRICSKEYFTRYFTYSVPPGDIGDLEVQRLVDELRAEVDSDDVRARLARFSERRAMPRLLDKLRFQEATIDPEAAQRIALALAPNGALLPKEEGPWVMRTTVMQGAILIRQLLRRIAPPQREALALEIVQIAEPLPFAAECFRWLRFSKDESPDERILQADSEARVGQELASRISAFGKTGELYASFSNESRDLLWIWKNMGVPGQMEVSLRSWLNASPDSVDIFLGAFTGRAWGLESGLSRRSEFRRDSYESVAELIEPAFVAERLRAKLGAALESGEESESETEQEWKRQTARRFVVIHEFVLKEKQRPGPDERQDEG
jgi:KAP family P-loop domain